MGLNPPFGVNASFANKFITKTLEFKPKLLILIVPKETKPLDQDTYNLIWKDEELLAGKSFYLLGSVDVHNKQIDDWNNKSPPLSLWSGCDWSDRHMTIAREYDHVINCQNQKLHGERNYIQNYLMEENCSSYWDYSSFYAYDDISGTLNSAAGHVVKAESHGARTFVHDKVTKSSFVMACSAMSAPEMLPEA